MIRRRAPFIEVRRAVFIGCEGASEASYAAVLQDLIRAADLPVHLHIRELAPGAGDPFARIEMAVRLLGEQQRKREAPAERFVFLDRDQAQAEPIRAERARKLAAEYNIAIIWQDPCFEALLLRHLPGCHMRRPPDTPEAGRALTREWKEYKKGMQRVDLARRIDIDAVLRAAVVEPGLRQLLICLGLIEPPA